MSRRRTARVATAVAIVVALLALVVVGRSGPDRDDTATDVPASTTTSSTVAPDPTTTSSTVGSTSTTTTTVAAPSPPVGERVGVEPEAFATADVEGRATVIVTLAVDPTGSFEQRREQVRAELDRVLAALPAGSYGDVVEDLSVPTIPMTVDRAALEVLDDEVAVEAVTLTRRFEPVDLERKELLGEGGAAPASLDATTTMGANLAWAAGEKGAGATIAVLDTGVDTDHPFLMDGATKKTIAEGCFASSSGSYTSPCPGGVSMAMDAAPVAGSAEPCPLQTATANCAHGTHVAGIAVGGDGTDRLSGIAPSATLIAVSVFSYSTSLSKLGASDADLIRAINWLLNRRAIDFPDLVAVNMSLGGATGYTGSCPGDPLAPSVALLLSVGVRTVVASGNDGYVNGVTSPGCIPDAITVGAVDDSTGRTASFSNDGPQVDVMAAGVSICSSLPVGTSGFTSCTLPTGGTAGYMSGTSMATPAVAGAIAVMKGDAVPSTEWQSRLQRVIVGGDCVQASAYTIPSLRVDVALELTGHRAAPCAPSAPSATLTGSTSATVSWLAPIAVGTGTLSSYTVTSTSGQSCSVAATSQSCTVNGLPYSTSVRFTVTAVATGGTSGASIQSNAITTGMFIPLTPARLADTRSPAVGASTIDGQFLNRGPIGPGSTYAIRVLGRGGVPSSGVGAVALNVTATNTSTSSFFTVYPSGAARPTASSLNFTMWQTVPNLVISGVGGDGAVAVFNALGSADVIVDVVGWYPAGGGYSALQPARLLDTRGGLPTVDGQFRGTGAIPQGAALSLVVAGRGGVPANAGSVVLNVTATNPSTSGFLTVYPRGAPRPTASNLNFTWLQTVPNAVIAAVGEAGRVEIFNALGTTDVVVDVVGWMPGGGQYNAMNPARLLDTRPGLSTVDGQYNGIGALPQGAGLPLQVTGRAGIPAGARAVVVNVTATNPSWWGFFTVYSTSSPRPTASNLNFSPGQTVPNLVVCGVGGDGRIMIFNALGTTDAIVDVVGWYS